MGKRHQVEIGSDGHPVVDVQIVVPSMERSLGDGAKALEEVATQKHPEPQSDPYAVIEKKGKDANHSD